MHLTRRSLCAAAMGALATPARADAALIEPAALREDLALLRRAWTELHPGLYRYLTPAALAARFAEADAWAGEPRALAAFYLELARLSAAVRCGHTYPNPANQGRAVTAALLDRPYAVPFGFRWLGRRMIVTAAMPGVALVTGDDISHLDGVPAAQLLSRLVPLMRADGGNDAKRVALAEVRPADSQSLFDLYRALKAPPRGDVDIRLRDGRSFTAPLVRVEARRAALGDEAWGFAIEEGVGRLTMPTWALYNSQWDWRTFLDSAIDRLIDENARGLIVDLRGNEGGQDVIGDTLLARLIAAPLTKPQTRLRVRYRTTPPDLNAALTTRDQGFKDWGERADGPAADGFYDLRPLADDVAILPAGRRFAGPVAVLTDATNSSATFGFARLFRVAARGPLIGATTGGSRRGINGGAYFFLRLPRSRLEVDLPLIGYFPVTAEPDRGIEPDIAVPWTAHDIRLGRDPALAAARRRLRDA